MTPMQVLQAAPSILPTVWGRLTEMIGVVRIIEWALTLIHRRGLCWLPITEAADRDDPSAGFVTRIAVWNAGRAPILRSQIQRGNPLVIRTADRSPLEETRILSATVGVAPKLSRPTKSKVDLKFHSLDSKQGFVVELRHHAAVRPVVAGHILGQRQPRKVSPRSSNSLSYLLWVGLHGEAEARRRLREERVSSSITFLKVLAFPFVFNVFQVAGPLSWVAFAAWMLWPLNLWWLIRSWSPELPGDLSTLIWAPRSEAARPSPA